MKTKDIIILLIFWLILLIPIIALLVMGTAELNDVSRLIPIESRIFDILFILVLSPLLMIIFIQFLSVILA